MLTELCGEIRNYFLRGQNDVHGGNYAILGGTISLPFLQVGQYFRIVGSVFNDGVYQYPAKDLHDEEFSGAVWAMYVPPEVIDLSRQIDEWREKNATALDSPYQSESFGGYSYTLKSGGNSGSGSGAITWQKQFASKLSRYRRLFPV